MSCGSSTALTCNIFMGRSLRQFILGAFIVVSYLSPCVSALSALSGFRMQRSHRRRHGRLHAPCVVTKTPATACRGRPTRSNTTN